MMQTIRAKNIIKKSCRDEINNLKRLRIRFTAGRIGYKFSKEEQEAIKNAEFWAINKAITALPIKWHFAVRDELGKNGFKTLPEFFKACVCE